MHCGVLAGGVDLGVSSGLVGGWGWVSSFSSGIGRAYRYVGYPGADAKDKTVVTIRLKPMHVSPGPT